MKLEWISTKDGETYRGVHAALEAGIGHALDDGVIGAVVGEGGILGAVLFNSYHPEEGVIEVNVAASSARWLSRRIMTEIFDYPFKDLGCQAVVSRVHPDNKRAIRLNLGCGFKPYEIPRLRGRNTPEIVMVLGDDDWARRGIKRG